MTISEVKQFFGEPYVSTNSKDYNLYVYRVDDRKLHIESGQLFPSGFSIEFSEKKVTSWNLVMEGVH